MARLRIGLAGLVALGGGPLFAAATAERVVDYDLGTGYHASYTDISTALGETSRTTGMGWGANPPLFLSNPYNNPWRPQDWVSIGQGGFITLELSHFAEALDDGPELNVLVFQQILASSGRPWYDREASVSVSENGVDWVALDGGEAISFDTPATGYVFPGSIPVAGGTVGGIDPATLGSYTESDYGLPMAGELDFSSAAAFEASRAAAYGLSGGGNWLDISGTGLSRVGFVRFDVAMDAPAYFALDAVYVNNNAIGAPVPEPTAVFALTSGAAVLVMRRRDRA